MKKTVGKIVCSVKGAYESLDGHVEVFGCLAKTEQVFQCLWCDFEVSVFTTRPEDAALRVVKHHKWVIGEDDAQVGICCPACIGKEGDDA